MDKGLSVPSNCVAPACGRLGTWLAFQREKHSRGELDAEKVARLDAIGMAW